MNILIYIPTISKQSGGVYQYTLGLLRILQRDQDNIYWIFNDYLCSDIIEIVDESSNFRRIKYEVKKFQFDGSFYYRLISKIQFHLGIQYFKPLTNIEKLCKKYNISIIHCPYQGFIFTNNKIPFISTMHDVQELHFPSFFTSTEREFRAINYKKAVEESTKVVVSYTHIKRDLLLYFNVKEFNIAVILLEMNKLWLNEFINKSELTKLELGVPEKYLIYPAATWPHKNHIFLLNAILELRNEGIPINLICTGHQTDYYHNTILPFIESNNLESIVFFKGIVSNFELYSLYKQAIGVVIPSLYEAGSFPLYESIILNVPVICSNTTSLPETIGDYRFVFDKSIGSLKNLLIQLYNDNIFRLSCKKLLLERLNWIKSLDSLSLIKGMYESIAKNL